MKVKYPRETNGPSGYPKDNPDFDRLAAKEIEANKEEAARAKVFLAKLFSAPDKFPTEQEVAKSLHAAIYTSFERNLGDSAEVDGNKITIMYHHENPELDPGALYEVIVKRVG